MSSEKRPKITKEMLDKEKVDIDLKESCLQTGVYDVQRINPFLGAIMQSLEIFYTHRLPRAGIMFDADGKKWQMGINPYWFCKQINKHNRKAVLLHELYHLTHKHPMRAPFMRLTQFARTQMNIAMDMAINQLIQDLPYGCKQCPPMEQQMAGIGCPNTECPGSCIMVEDYYDIDPKTDKKIPWEKNMPMDYYYQKLIQRVRDPEKGEEGNQDGMPQGGQQGSGQEEFDSHHWESGAEEQDMLDATEDLVKRAIQKRGLSMDRLPGFARELLEDIEARRAELNYRQLLLAAIKRHASGQGRKHTWARRSRRWGNIAPGTRPDKLPMTHQYHDSSGSISVQEANDNLAMGDEFLRVGARDCMVHLWHTRLYYSAKYKLGDRFDKKMYQSGGTDVTDVMKHIAEHKPDLSIIYTDGCFGDVDYESMIPPNELFPQVLWVISRDGDENHPLKRCGETIKVPNTERLKVDEDF